MIVPTLPNQQEVAAMATEHRQLLDESASERHKSACQLAVAGQIEAAAETLLELYDQAEQASLRASLLNDLGVLDAVRGNWDKAAEEFGQALQIDPDCERALANCKTLRPRAERRLRIAILSLLFSWPSTGGGTIHTKECAEFLQRFGYEVRHIYASFPGWGVGNVTEPLGVPSSEVRFDESTWNADTIRDRFRDELDQYQPDFVIITDSWNTKPLLAEASSGYRYFLRIAALECICPLNNVRLLVDQGGSVQQCQASQLEDPVSCQRCVHENRKLSGGLHQAERLLADFDDDSYASRLLNVMANAEGALVVNRQIAELVRTFTPTVEVVPSGFDADRFPPISLQDQYRLCGRPQIFFAGLVQEFMKGFSVLEAAGRELWSRRQDFEFVVTADPSGSRNEFTRFIGWQSQAALPQRMIEADIVVFPTIAQEALGRSAVEAMGCGKPVIASRIGGLPDVVDDEQTGLLVEPGNAGELAAAIERLLDDRALRENMGRAGREKFQREYTWDVIIQRHYQRLFGDPVLMDGGELISAPSITNGAKNNSVRMRS